MWGTLETGFGHTKPCLQSYFPVLSWKYNRNENSDNKEIITSSCILLQTFEQHLHVYVCIYVHIHYSVLEYPQRVFNQEIYFHPCFENFTSTKHKIFFRFQLIQVTQPCSNWKRSQGNPGIIYLRRKFCHWVEWRVSKVNSKIMRLPSFGMCCDDKLI